MLDGNHTAVRTQPIIGEETKKRISKALLMSRKGMDKVTMQKLWAARSNAEQGEEPRLKWTHIDKDKPPKWMQILARWPEYKGKQCKLPDQQLPGKKRPRKE